MNFYLIVLDLSVYNFLIKSHSLKYNYLRDWILSRRIKCFTTVASDKIVLVPSICNLQFFQLNYTLSSTGDSLTTVLFAPFKADNEQSKIRLNKLQVPVAFRENFRVIGFRLRVKKSISLSRSLRKKGRLLLHGGVSSDELWSYLSFHRCLLRCIMRFRPIRETRCPVLL